MSSMFSYSYLRLFFSISFYKCLLSLTKSLLKSFWKSQANLKFQMNLSCQLTKTTSKYWCCIRPTQRLISFLLLLAQTQDFIVLCRIRNKVQECQKHSFTTSVKSAVPLPPVSQGQREHRVLQKMTLPAERFITVSK